MMDKLLTYPGRTENGIHTFLIQEEHGHLVKTASEYHPIISSYINAAKPIPGVTQILLTALGAGEFWGANANGDWFGEDQLAHEGEDYGYKTFEYLAKLYKHHVNKDRTANYGDVLLSVYNPIYHRVELVVGVNHERAPDIIERIENGEYPVWSMGCRIPFDICSICGNKAPSRKYYCEHLRYMLGQIDPDTGKQVYAINIRPKFHDISYVLIPADKTAYMLKKVASVQVPLRFPGSAEIAEKLSQVNKKSEIDKRVPVGEPPSSQEVLTSELARLAAKTILEVRRREAPLPTGVLDRLCAMGPLSEVLSTMSSALIVPTPQEFQRIILVYNGHRGAADDFQRINASFDPLAHPPVTEEHRQTVGLSPDRVRGDMLQVLSPYLASRSYSAPIVAQRMAGMVKQAQHYYPDPRYFNPNEKEDSSSLLKMLGVGSALYAALMLENKTKAFSTLAKLVSQHPTIATGLGVGAVLGARQIHKAVTQPNVRGSFTPDTSLYPDTFDLYDRVSRTSDKPYLKVSCDTSVERLLVGMPMAFMASCASQRHGFSSPSEYEMVTQKVAQDLSELLSGPTVTAAPLIGTGNGPGPRLPHGDLLKAAGVIEESTPRFSESTFSSRYMGTLVDEETHQKVGHYDQVILELGLKLEELGKRPA